MPALQEITSNASFESTVADLHPSTLVILYFHAPWAPPCVQMRNILSALASTYPDTTPATISFYSIDAEALPDISESYDVTAVPFLALQREGKTLESVSGCDADKVRRAVEKWVGKGETGNGSREIPAMLEIRSRNGDHEPAGPTKEEENGIAEKRTKNLSTYAPDPSAPQTAPGMTSKLDQSETKDQTAQDELHARLAGLVKAVPVMLFMKGTPSAPQCGFSRQMVGILRERGVRYGFFNILADEEVRQGLKTWADWPTYPQLWVGGELVGGLDIVKEELENNPDFFKDYSIIKPRSVETAEA